MKACMPKKTGQLKKTKLVNNMKSFKKNCSDHQVQFFFDVSEYHGKYPVVCCCVAGCFVEIECQDYFQSFLSHLTED